MNWGYGKLETCGRVSVLGQETLDEQDARLDSDWDFLILLPSTANKALEMQIKDCLYDVELETDTVLSSIIRSKLEWESAKYAVLPLRQHIERDGIAV